MPKVAPYVNPRRTKSRRGVQLTELAASTGRFDVEVVLERPLFVTADLAFVGPTERVGKLFDGQARTCGRMLGNHRAARRVSPP